MTSIAQPPYDINTDPFIVTGRKIINSLKMQVASKSLPRPNGAPGFVACDSHYLYFDDKDFSDIYFDFLIKAFADKKEVHPPVTLEKAIAFAVRIINLYKYLCKEKKEFVLSKQLLRAGTSIGANLTEAQFAISKKDFLSKSYIAYKECGETLYWIDLLNKTDYLSIQEYESINNDCEELMRLLTMITKTTSKNIRNG